MALSHWVAILCCALVPAPAAAAAPPACSAAGALQPTGECNCDAGWMGPTCATLDNATALKVSSGCNLADRGWHVWGSDVVYDPVSMLWHMVASIYPRNQSFYSIWLFDARIIHASAENYWGPFCDGAYTIALDHGADDAWDRSVMNPKLLRDPKSGVWLLVYTGDSYNGSWPVAGEPLPPYWSAQASQRVGVAWAASPAGPYQRLGHPVLETRPGKWDSRIVTNPAVTAMPNGSLLMVYKASNPAPANATQKQVCFGAARADNWHGPWVRVRDDPILPCPADTFYAEDPTLWYDAARGAYHLVFKDFAGHFTHAGYSGAHAVSVDGVTWALTEPALAYGVAHRWDDGVVRRQPQQERAQFVLSPADGAPLAMTFATNAALNGSELFWNMVMPVRPWPAQ